MRNAKSPHLADRHVGARVRMQRIFREMSQTALADALGITFQQVQKYEKGVNRIGASRLQQIAHALQVPIAFFFEGLEEARPSNSSDEALLTEFASTAYGMSLARSFLKITDVKVRRALVNFVEELANAADKKSK